MKTPQLHTKMCLAGISHQAHKICGSSPLRVRHLALFWLILRCLTHDKEKKYSSCPKNVIPSAQIWSGTYLKKNASCPGTCQAATPPIITELTCLPIKPDKTFTYNSTKSEYESVTPLVHLLLAFLQRLCEIKS